MLARRRSYFTVTAWVPIGAGVKARGPTWEPTIWAPARLAAQEVSPDWAEDLRRFADALGLPWQEPAWLLASDLY